MGKACLVTSVKRTGTAAHDSTPGGATRQHGRGRMIGLCGPAPHGRLGSRPGLYLSGRLAAGLAPQSFNPIDWWLRCVSWSWEVGVGVGGPRARERI